MSWFWARFLALIWLASSLCVADDTDVDVNLSVDTEHWDCSVRHPRLLIFNRVPKCGSTSFQAAMTSLWSADSDKARSLGNHIHPSLLIESKDLYDRDWNAATQLSVMTSLEAHSKGRSVLYNRHMYWIDVEDLYAKNGRSVLQPRTWVNGHWSEETEPFVDWINLLRDPVERAVSLFYFQQQIGIATVQNITLDEAIDSGLIDYQRSPTPAYAQRYCNYYTRWFCGQDLSCRGGDRVALSKAIHVLRTQYSMVGTTDTMGETMWALQKLYPAWFGESTQSVDGFVIPHLNVGTKKRERKSKSHNVVSERALKRLRELNENDIILYEWVKEYFGARLRVCAGNR